MDQHQHSTLPMEKLKGIPEPVTALLQVLLAKDPGQRFQTPAQLQKALTKTEGAIASGGRLTPDELRSTSAEAIPLFQTANREQSWFDGSWLQVSAWLSL